MITDILISLIAPLTAGVLVSFTPCVAVLFPITFYRFMSDKGTDYKSYMLYAAGFIFAFTLAGLLFQQLFESQIQNGIKLAVALSLIMLGILQFFNRINPLNLKPVKNTFIFGMIFALAVGVNPCAIPYLGALFGLSLGIEISPKLFLFAVGILIPPTLLLVFGNALLSHIRAISEKMSYVNKPMSILLFASGVYMGLNILLLSPLDLIISSALILILLLVILKIFFIENSIKDLLTIPRILLVVSLLIIWFVFTYHCYGIAKLGEEEATCSLTCYVCQRCLILFSISIIFGIIGSILLKKYEKGKWKIPIN